MKFEVGQRVIKKSSVQRYEQYEGEKQVVRGVVTLLNEKGRVTVKWDSKWIDNNPETLLPEKLLSEAEGDQKFSELEAEFKLWADPIREKLKMAGKLLEEADALAKKQKTNLSDLWSLTDEFMESLDNVGWRSSSLGC